MTGDVKNRVKLPVRLSIADHVKVTPEVIDYFLRMNKSNLARYKLLEEYYHNQTAIQNRTMSDFEKPNNKISHAFARYITKIATAYFMGYGIRYEAKPKAYKKELDRMLDANITQIQHFEEAKEMSKCGVSYELLFIDPNGQLKSKFFRARDMVPIFSQTPDSYLAMVLRPYTVKSIDNRSKVQEFVEVYDQQYVSIYHRSSGSKWSLQEQFSHNFADVPVIIRSNNAELKGDYEDVIPQIDAYDKAQSDTSNDLDYFSDAYLVMEGLDDITAVDDDGNELSVSESAKIMRQNKLIYVPSGCKASFITKENNDIQAEHYKDRLRKDTFFLSQVPNLTDEEFAGNLSGVAIKYKLFGLEELVIEKETYFTSSELKKVRLITDYINKLKNTRYDWRTVELKFDRSAVANTLEIAQIMNLLRDVLSDETIVGMWPEVKDTAEEIQRKLQEEQQRENSSQPQEDEEVF